MNGSLPKLTLQCWSKERDIAGYHLKLVSSPFSPIPRSWPLSWNDTLPFIDNRHVTVSPSAHFLFERNEANKENTYDPAIKLKRVVVFLPNLENSFEN